MPKIKVFKNLNFRTLRNIINKIHSDQIKSKHKNTYNNDKNTA